MHQLQEKTPQDLTKLKILSQINSIYDPLELVDPFTIWAEVLMRQLWASEVKIDWDVPLPEGHKRDWVKLFMDLFDMSNTKFQRCLKPPNTIGDPSLVIFSDGSDSAYGACAYVRWALDGRGFDNNLVMSKNRLGTFALIVSTHTYCARKFTRHVMHESAR